MIRFYFSFLIYLYKHMYQYCVILQKFVSNFLFYLYSKPFYKYNFEKEFKEKSMDRITFNKK